MHNAKLGLPFHQGYVFEGASVICVRAKDVAHLIDKPANEWTPASLRQAFLKYGCAVVRGAIPVYQLDWMSEIVARAYQHTNEVHVYDRDLMKFSNGNVSGFELSNTDLLQGLLQAIFVGQNWRRESVTARRIQGVELNHDWQRPLDLHLDCQFHPFQFTVNFWIPFEECGIDAPGLQLVPLDYPSTRRYAGFTGEPLRPPAEKWHLEFFPEGRFELSEVEATFGPDCFLRPHMKPGDLIVSSNWILHGSYREPTMKAGRTSVEIRFIGETIDVNLAV